MDNFVLKTPYNLVGRNSWSAFTRKCIIVGTLSGEVVDMNPVAAEEIMAFFSPDYGVDPSIFEDVVIKDNTRILECYNLDGLVSIPDVMDDPKRITYIPEVILSVSGSEKLSNAQRSFFSVVGTYDFKGVYNATKMRNLGIKMQDAIQRVCPGFRVQFQNIEDSLKSTPFVINERVVEKNALDAIFDAQNIVDREYNAQIKDVQDRYKALASERSELDSQIKFTNEKFDEAVAYAVVMQEFVKLLDTNHIQWRNLDISDEMIIEIDNIKTGAFFKK